MHLAWLPKLVVPIAVLLAFRLVRRIAPPVARQSGGGYEASQRREPFAPGIIGSAMWGIGIALAMLFFVLRSANHLWASLEGPSLLTQYAPQVYWGFLPGFAALSLPWPITIWCLRKIGRGKEADSIRSTSDSEVGFDSFVVMKWLGILVVAPIAFFTVLAVPIHLSVTPAAIRVGHYASFRSDIFPLKDARSLTIIDIPRTTGNRIVHIKDAILQFADGSSLSLNQISDGDTSVREDLLKIVIQTTGLTPRYRSNN